MAKAELRTSSKSGNVAKDMLSANVVEYLMDSVGEKFLDKVIDLAGVGIDKGSEAYKAVGDNLGRWAYDQLTDRSSQVEGDPDKAFRTDTGAYEGRVRPEHAFFNPEQVVKQETGRYGTTARTTKKVDPGTEGFVKNIQEFGYKNPEAVASFVRGVAPGLGIIALGTGASLLSGPARNEYSYAVQPSSRTGGTNPNANPKYLKDQQALILEDKKFEHEKALIEARAQARTPGWQSRAGDLAYLDTEQLWKAAHAQQQHEYEMEMMRARAAYGGGSGSGPNPYGGGSDPLAIAAAKGRELYGTGLKL
mgnify:CR=1 FL=1